MLTLTIFAAVSILGGAQAPTAEAPTAVSGVEVPGEAPKVQVSRREIAIAKKQLKSRGDVVVCRRTQVTGSRFGGPPVCKTNREWSAAADRNRDNVDLALRRQWSPDKAPGYIDRATGVPSWSGRIK